MQFRSYAAFLILILTCLLPVFATGDASPEQVLGARGLVKVGFVWLLPADAQLRDGLRTMRRARQQLENATEQRNRLQSQIGSADLAMLDLLQQEENIARQMAKDKKLTFRYNEDIVKLRAVDVQLKQTERFEEDCRKQLADVADPQEDYITAVLDLSDKMEAADQQYKKLSADPDVTKALSQLNAQGGFRQQLGPSAAFIEEFPDVRRARSAVNTAAIKFVHDSNTPEVNVVLNGEVTVPMTFDSGASAVSISWDLAARLGITPGQHDPVIKTTIANGKAAEAYPSVLKSVRLGPFTAENVLCIICPKSEKGAPNLLGGTFLQNFVYRMDLAHGEVRLTQVSGKADPNDLRGGPGGVPGVPLTAIPGPSASTSQPSAPPSTANGPSKQPDRSSEQKWTVIFHSADPADWDTSVNNSNAYAIPLEKVPVSMSYLRMRNSEGDYVIVPLTADELKKRIVRDKSGWEGRDLEKYGARHLGIFVKSMSPQDTGMVHIALWPMYTGYGFGNRYHMNDHQGYVWAGKPVEKEVIEIAVTSESLTDSEKQRLLSD